jgi:transcriptional regulator with XRE-family HTH domain
MQVQFIASSIRRKLLMGTKARPKPQHLGEKLRQVRLALDLTQAGMLKHLGLEGTIMEARISEYETGIREPSLMTVLEYARAAAVHMEALVDDEIDLPDKLPGSVKYDSIKRQYPTRHAAKKRRTKS